RDPRPGAARSDATRRLQLHRREALAADGGGIGGQLPAEPRRRRRAPWRRLQRHGPRLCAARPDAGRRRPGARAPGRAAPLPARHDRPGPPARRVPARHHGFAWQPLPGLWLPGLAAAGGPPQFRVAGHLRPGDLCRSGAAPGDGAPGGRCGRPWRCERRAPGARARCPVARP
ncbi:hypothetical protein KXX11_004209, partial [Aspergillus fumigatus]